jgi:deoxyribonuclease-4
MGSANKKTSRPKAEPRSPRLGAHESIAGGVFNAILRGQQATCDTIQLFNKSNNQWKARPLSDDEIQKYFDIQEETGVDVACSHTSYLINLASPELALNKRSRESLAEEMRRCDVLKIPNLVLHPGSHVGSGVEMGTERIAQNINRLFDAMPDGRVKLCLETTAGQGSNIGSTFEELARIIDMIGDKVRMGVCLDTCHVFAAGYALAPRKDYLATIRSFDRIIGLNFLKVIHLNDSKKEFGSRRDRHEHIGKGHIGLEAFCNILNDRRLKRIPMVIETPKGDDLAEDIENLKTLRALIRKR